MVLTNFECWAHGGSDNLSVNGLIERRGNSVDLFNASLLQQSRNNITSTTQMDTGADSTADTKFVSHLSSNGYYGFVAFKNTENSASGGGVENCIGAEKGGEEQHEQYFVNTPGCDVTMEIEQHCDHMVGAVEPRNVCENEVNSLLSSGSEPLAASVQSCDDFVIENRNVRRKRGFIANIVYDGEDHAIKRFRTDNDNLWTGPGSAQTISRPPSDGVKTKHFVSTMDHENIPTTVPLTTKQATAHFGLEQNHIYPNIGQISNQHEPISGILHPFTENNSAKSTTKSKQCTHSLETNSINESGEDANNSFAKSSNRLQLCLSDVDTKNRIDTNMDTVIINATEKNCEANQLIHKNENDELLENLFLSLHGCSNFQMWRHFSNFSNDDI